MLLFIPTEDIEETQSNETVRLTIVAVLSTVSIS